MCYNPVRLKDGTTVPCGRCRFCRDQKVNDLIGRCIAEDAVSKGSLSVTLTYAGDCPSSAFLNYRDVQLMLKRLRVAGYKVRYLFAGEYGEGKGRAHWHGVLFFSGNVPPVQMDSRFSWLYWPHGYSFFRRSSPGAFAYVCKYTLKDDHTQKRVYSSKFPPLGNDFFIPMAREIAEKGQALWDLNYSFVGVGYKKKPGLRVYTLRGRMAELYLSAYVERWKELRSDPPPLTPLVEAWIDKIARQENALDPLLFEWRVKRREPAASVPRAAAPLGLLVLPGDGLVTAHPFRRCEVSFGGETNWITASESAGLLERQLNRLHLPPSLSPNVADWIMRVNELSAHLL